MGVGGREGGEREKRAETEREESRRGRGRGRKGGRGEKRTERGERRDEKRGGTREQRRELESFSLTRFLKGEGGTKKLAERSAAEDACRKLRSIIESEDGGNNEPTLAKEYAELGVLGGLQEDRKDQENAKNKEEEKHETEERELNRSY